MGEIIIKREVTKTKKSIFKRVLSNLPLMIFFIFWLLISVILFYMNLFALGGSNPTPAIIIIITLLVSNLLIIISFWKKKALLGLIVCYFTIAYSINSDSDHWKKHNSDMCTDLRNDPDCNEGKNGWTCSESSKFGNMFTASTICKNNQ